MRCLIACAAVSRSFGWPSRHDRQTYMQIPCGDDNQNNKLSYPLPRFCLCRCCWSSLPLLLFFLSFPQKTGYIRSGGVRFFSVIPEGNLLLPGCSGGPLITRRPAALSHILSGPSVRLSSCCRKSRACGAQTFFNAQTMPSAFQRRFLSLGIGDRVPLPGRRQRRLRLGHALRVEDFGDLGLAQQPLLPRDLDDGLPARH